MPEPQVTQVVPATQVVPDDDVSDRLLTLVDVDGLTVAAAARRLGITAARARRLYDGGPR